MEISNTDVVNGLQRKLLDFQRKLLDVPSPMPPSHGILKSRSPITKKYNPKLHILYSKEKAKELESYKDKVVNINKMSERKRYEASPKVRHLWSTLAALCPISLWRLELIAGMTIKLFLEKTNLLDNTPDLNMRIALAFTPSQTFIRNVIHEGAGTKLAILCKKIKGKISLVVTTKATKKELAISSK